jgi:hypothetical protein
MCLPNSKKTLNILNDIAIVPYSVLGTQLTKSSGIVQKAVVPGVHCMFVDPAGLQYIQNFGPHFAGGASGEIYHYIGISKDIQFPRAVRNEVKMVGDAYWHTYKGVFQCCHVVGPNFSTMTPEPSEKTALEVLTVVYTNIFRQFFRSNLLYLRLLPVSGGIYSGKFEKKMPTLTFMAIIQAVQKLKKNEYEYLMNAIAHSQKTGLSAIEMCIFEENQLKDFQKVAKSLIHTVV